MARSGVNNFGMRFAREAALGVKPTTGWRILEPNNPTAFGAVITTVERRPISPDRGRKKGTVVNLESTVEYEGDLTMDAFDDFAEGFVFAEYANKEFRDDMVDAGAPATPSATGYDIDAASALLAGKVQWTTAAEAMLFFAKGYGTAANNGLKPITADLATSGTEITVAGNALEASPPANASLQVAGVRLAIGDLALTVSGSTATLVSAAHITDWSTLGLFPGMYVHIGSDDGTGARQNMFDDGASGDVYGYARISSISGATLNLDKIDVKLSTTDASNATAVDLLFGRFLRNVETTASAPDNEFLERSYSFEGSYADLEGAGTPGYEYAVGNFANELVLNLPLIDKATATWGFIGTTTEDIVAARASGPATAVSPLRTEAINTSAGFAVITTDVVASQSDVCFKSITMTLNNNVSPENCLGTLGAVFINSGLFEVNLEGQMLFTRKEIINAIKNNTTTTFSSILKNADGALAMDVPAMTFGDGQKEFPQDASVLVNITGTAFNDPAGVIPDVSIGISLFPTVPEDRS